MTDEPQAFPTLSSTNEVLADGTEQHVRSHYSNPGMSLRDYFAAQALAGLCANLSNTDHAATMAERAYKHADAMLEAREEK